MKKRLDSIEALRALACIAVFLYHSGIDLAGPAAVCIFFMLSGFTLSYSELRRGSFAMPGIIGSARAAVKRVWKLYPLYIICMLPVLALDLWELRAVFSPEALTALAKKFAVCVLLLQSWVPNADVAVAFNGVAWFLSTLLFLYFCFPYVFGLIRKLKTVGAAFTAIIALALVQTALGFAAAPLEVRLLGLGLIPDDGKFAYWFSYIFPAFRLFDFSIGCILGWIYAKPAEKPRPAHARWLEAVTLAALVLTHFVYKYSEPLNTWEAFKYTQIYLPFSVLAILSFALAQGDIVKLLTNKLTLFVAGISSDFFLLHQNIIRFSILFLSMAAIPFAAIKVIVPPLCFVLTVAACLIWAWIENKAKALIGKKQG